MHVRLENTKGQQMPRKSFTPEQIINKLLEADIIISQGATLAAMLKKIGVKNRKGV
ncbi:hypothetical protein DGWBC_0856 [Dehalogenimonas sp. WBC-2]|nr:hypothetical protein DGWBC_0856 [Dehalogenimonas sp. WBC-2]